jgi:hypothetical protein
MDYDMLEREISAAKWLSVRYGVLLLISIERIHKRLKSRGAANEPQPRHEAAT